MTDSELEKDFRLGPWIIRPLQGEMDGPDGTRRVGPKVMDVLVALARSPGQVVQRETLITEVWGGRAMSDEPLFGCIAELRKKLGDSSHNPTYIQTVPKRGYRLIAPIEALASPSQTLTSSSSLTTDDRPQGAEVSGLQFIRLLGQGSMGTVHLAREAALERLVALKTLRPELAADEHARRRFQREAQSAARVAHPSVATVYRIGHFEDGVPFIVQQYVEGVTLQETLEIEGSIDVDRAVVMLRQLASALAMAHRAGVIHRDVKPGNILVAKDDDRVVLTDFGIAGIQETGSRIVTRLTRAGERLGDPGYISPEQVKGEPVTTQSDVYSLGIVAYELLSSQYPYAKTPEADRAFVHVDGTPVPLSDLRPDVPAPLARAVHRCLEKRPEDRPTAEQLERQLNADSTQATAPNHDRPAAARPPDAEGNVNSHSPQDQPARLGSATKIALAIAASVAIGVMLWWFAT